MLHPDLFVLSSPGMASIIMLRSKASTTLCIVDDGDDDCNSQAVSSLDSKMRHSVLHRSQIPADRQHTYHLVQLWENAVKLFWHYTHTTLLQLCGFVRDKPGELVPEETCTHSHLSWSSITPICFLHLLQSTAFSSDTTGRNIPKTATHFTSSNDRSYCSELCLGKRSGSCQRMLTNHNFV